MKLSYIPTGLCPFCFFRLFCEACEFGFYLLPGPVVAVRDVYVVFRGELVAVGVGVVAVPVMVGVEAERCALLVGDSAVHVDRGVGCGVCLEPRVACGEVDVAVDAVWAHLQGAVIAVEGEGAAVNSVGGGEHGGVPSWVLGGSAGFSSVLRSWPRRVVRGLGCGLRLL